MALLELHVYVLVSPVRPRAVEGWSHDSCAIVSSVLSTVPGVWWILHIWFSNDWVPPILVLWSLSASLSHYPAHWT